MVKLTVLYGHPTDAAAFERHYTDVHLPLALKIKGLRRFEVGTVAGAPDGSKAPFYRSAELYFDDIASLQAALGSSEGTAAAGDIGNFASGGATLLISEVQDLTPR